MQILSAIIEKTLPDLPLYSSFILEILEIVLKVDELPMAEASLPLFSRYCRYQNALSLSPDDPEWQQHHKILQTYVGFAQLDFAATHAPKLSKEVARKWKELGLCGILIALHAPMLGVDGGKQIRIIMPVVLGNLPTDKGELLSSLRLLKQPEHGRNMVTEVAQSLAIRDSPTATSPSILIDQELSKSEEGRIRALALLCLKTVFLAQSGDVRDRLRLATTMILKYILQQDASALQEASSSPKLSQDSDWTENNWAVLLVRNVVSWTPRRHKFTIVETALELLVQISRGESKLHHQLIFASLLLWLLSSSIDMAGLNVVDTLDEILGQLTQVVQADAPPNRQMSSLVDTQSSMPAEKDRRTELAVLLQECVGGFAGRPESQEHIFAMSCTALRRLKASPGSRVPSSITLSVASSTEVMHRTNKSANYSDSTRPDDLPLCAAAYMANLKAVKQILTSANTSISTTTALAVQSRDDMEVWSGTQWLLRENDRNVRTAYADAFLTWLHAGTCERGALPASTSSSDPCQSLPRSGEDADEDFQSRKGLSIKEGPKGSTETGSSFLSLFHVAIYDTITQGPEIEADILLSHLLLTNMTQHLGITAVRHSLPMIGKMLDELEARQVFNGWVARFNVQSLVYGYLWALSQRFEFEHSEVGEEISSKIAQMKDRDHWLHSVQVPALPLDEIAKVTATASARPEKQSGEVAADFFVSNIPRAVIADAVWQGYCTSPERSSRERDLPRSRSHSTTSSDNEAKRDPALDMPRSMRGNHSSVVMEDLLSEWSKDAVLTRTQTKRIDNNSVVRVRRSSASRANSRDPRGTPRFADLKMALSGNTRSPSRYPSPLRKRPMSLAMTSIVTSVQSRDSSGRQSPTGSEDDADKTTAQNKRASEDGSSDQQPAQEPTSVPQPSTTSYSRSETRLTEYVSCEDDVGGDSTSAGAHTDNSVPPVPKIPPSFKAVTAAVGLTAPSQSSRGVSPTPSTRDGDKVKKLRKSDTSLRRNNENCTTTTKNAATTTSTSSEGNMTTTGSSLAPMQGSGLPIADHGKTLSAT